MAVDPFSIIAGTCSLVDISTRLVRFLQGFKESVAGTKDELESLEHEINSIKSISESIKDSFEDEVKNCSDKLVADPTKAEALWRNVGNTLRSCERRLEDLSKIVQHVAGEKSQDNRKGNKDHKYTATFESWKVQLRKNFKSAKIEQIQSDLVGYKHTLSLSLTLIGVIYQKESQSASDELVEIVNTLSVQVELLKPYLASSHRVDVRDSVRSVNALISSLSFNKFFELPQGVSSIYTGRQLESDRLKLEFLDALPSPGRSQKRFVIYGLEGSGKTQFCCKFAYDYRQHFHAVFWVDASSKERADKTFSEIAKKGVGEHNRLAGMNWLSTLDKPWLLIIDNAEDPTLPLETMLPASERGFILITTRNPAHKIYGTVGPGSFHFTGMESSAASDLLLKAAGEPMPWNSRTKKSAFMIAEILGCLPLALVQAGKAVLKRRCSLHDFESYFRRTRQRVINAQRSSSEIERPKIADSDTEINVFATYEMLYRGLAEKGTFESSNAIELLHMFAFFHRENIREDILLRAVKNPLLEQQARENAPSPNVVASLSSEFLKGKIADMLVYLFRITRGPPVMPRVLRDVEDLDDLHEDQIRAALSELSALSLIIYNASNHSYYIHPLVHTWIRERPEMKTTEQAVWCQAAATTLARSILLPSDGLGDSEEDADFRRGLLLHIDHVRKCQEAIQAQITKNQRSRLWIWPVPKETMDDRQAGQIARFSLVYAECGNMQEAERLQKRAKDFFCGLLGLDHPVSRLLQVGLSRTYWVLGRPTEAAQLQSTVLEVCLRTKGPNAHETLSMMDMLGTTRMQQGQFKEAMGLHKAALEGMSCSLGVMNPDRLKAMNHLACVYSKYFEYEKTRELLTESSRGLFQTLGPTHPDTLIAQEDLAMVYNDLGGSLRDDGHSIMLDVLAKRKEKLGREHPFTLLAMCHLARTKADRGDFEEAEALLYDGLAIAKRNLGETHIGTLYGRSHLGRVLLMQRRYREAEDALVDTIKKYELSSAARNGEHPDRLIAMRLLIDCYQEQNKIPEAIAISEEAIAGLRMIKGQDHVLMRKLEARLEELHAFQQTSSAGPRKAGEKPMEIPSSRSETVIGVVSSELEYLDHSTVLSLG